MSHVRSLMIAGGATMTVAALALAAPAVSSANPPGYPPTTIPNSGHVPGRPSTVRVKPSNHSATVSWTASGVKAGDAAVTGYVVTATPGGKTCYTTGTSCTVTGLTDGVEYTFTVRATSAAGYSNASSGSAIPSTVPDVPTNITGSRGDKTVTVNWQAPTYTGGAPVTSYTVELKSGGVLVQEARVKAGVFSYTFPALHNGVTYTYVVLASNADGQGTSVVGGTATPATFPRKPSINNASLAANNTHGSVSWSAPSFNGGSPINSYLVIVHYDSTPHAHVVSSAARSYNFTVPNNDHHVWVSVEAINAVGASVASSTKQIR